MPFATQQLLQTMLVWDHSCPSPSLRASKVPRALNGRQESGLAALPGSAFGHWGNPCWGAAAGLGALAAMGAFAPWSLRLLRPLASAAGDECSASRHRNAPGLGTTGNVVTPAILPCTFGRFSLKSGLACGFGGSRCLV